MLNWSKYENFQRSEFDSPDYTNSGDLMQSSTLNLLQKARTLSKTPFVITSGFRSKAHNTKVNGVSDSAHLTGKAVDIAVTPLNYVLILSSLIKAGFRRIGLYAKHIHADNDHKKKTPACWTYTEKLKTLKDKIYKILNDKQSTSWLSVFAPAIILLVLYTLKKKKKNVQL